MTARVLHVQIPTPTSPALAGTLGAALDQARAAVPGLTLTHDPTDGYTVRAPLVPGLDVTLPPSDPLVAIGYDAEGFVGVAVPWLMSWAVRGALQADQEREDVLGTKRAVRFLFEAREGAERTVALPVLGSIRVRVI